MLNVQVPLYVLKPAIPRASGSCPLGRERSERPGPRCPAELPAGRAQRAPPPSASAASAPGPHPAHLAISESHEPLHSTKHPPCARMSTTRGAMVALVHPVPVSDGSRSGRRAVVPALADRGRGVSESAAVPASTPAGRVVRGGFRPVKGVVHEYRTRDSPRRFPGLRRRPGFSRPALRTDSGRRRGTCSAGAGCCGTFRPVGAVQREAVAGVASDGFTG